MRIIGKRADNDTKKTWTLDFKKNEKWIRFEKLKKHNLRNIQIPASYDFNNKLELNPNSSNLYFAPGGGQPIEPPVEVKSYTENKDRTKVYPLPWGIFYRNQAWIDTDMSQLIYPAAPDNGFTKMNLFMKETAPLNQDYVRKLNAMKALPAKNDCDLSLFGTARYTANCYIVNSKGTYKFPLAYGNACKSGITNIDSFTCMHNYEIGRASCRERV